MSLRVDLDEILGRLREAEQSIKEIRADACGADLIWALEALLESVRGLAGIVRELEERCS